MKQLQSFFLGILGAIGALILEIIAISFFTPISSTAEAITIQLASPDYLFFAIIAIEEFFKFILIYKVVLKISEKKNLVLNSLFLGAGFSMLELFSFYWNFKNEIGFEPLAALGIIVIHISTSIIIGYSVLKNYSLSLLFGFLGSFFIHSAYNILGASMLTNQKQLIISLLIVLVLLDFFLLIRSAITASKEQN